MVRLRRYAFFFFCNYLNFVSFINYFLFKYRNKKRYGKYIEMVNFTHGKWFNYFSFSRIVSVNKASIRNKESDLSK